jgi:hypothetical protein
LRRWYSTVAVVTNSVSAISRFWLPSAASSAMRRSLGVSASAPVVARRRGRAPVARSSASAKSSRGAAAVRDVEGPAQRRAGRLSLAGAAQRGAQLGFGTGALEPRRRGLARRDRLLQQPDFLAAAGHRRRGAQGDGERARCGQRARQGQLLVGQPVCLGAPAEREQRVRQL